MGRTPEERGVEHPPRQVAQSGGLRGQEIDLQ